MTYGHLAGGSEIVSYWSLPLPPAVPTTPLPRPSARDPLSEISTPRRGRVESACTSFETSSVISSLPPFGFAALAGGAALPALLILAACDLTVHALLL